MSRMDDLSTGLPLATATSGPVAQAATLSRDAQAVLRAVSPHLAGGERLDMCAEACLGPHPLLTQMLFSLTMGGPRPRTQSAMDEPSRGVVVVTERRLFVAAYDRAVMEVGRAAARVTGTGGSPMMPWADVMWGDRTVRVGFHWGRATRDRLVELIGTR